MYTNPLLEEKYRVQKYMSEKAGHDIEKLLDMVEEQVREIEKKYNFKLKYSNRKPYTGKTG
jgi:hypothetical protein